MTSTNAPQLMLVLDVESIGLHGEGFAFGYLVMDGAGRRLHEELFASQPAWFQGTKEDRAWVRENVPELQTRALSPRELRTRLWKHLTHWKGRGAQLFADCAWPVEARMLLAAVDDAPTARCWAGPYPLQEVASVLWAAGMDPLADVPRLADELPAHNPLHDARHSARKLQMALAKLPAHQGATS